MIWKSFCRQFWHVPRSAGSISGDTSCTEEAGVVDSGGQGLLEVLHGAYDAFLGKEIDYSAIEASAGTKMTKAGAQAEADIKFGYCARIYHYDR